MADRKSMLQRRSTIAKRSTVKPQTVRAKTGRPTGATAAAASPPSPRRSPRSSLRARRSSCRCARRRTSSHSPPRVRRGGPEGGRGGATRAPTLPPPPLPPSPAAAAAAAVARKRPAGAPPAAKPAAPAAPAASSPWQAVTHPDTGQTYYYVSARGGCSACAVLAGLDPPSHCRMQRPGRPHGRCLSRALLLSAIPAWDSAHASTLRWVHWQIAAAVVAESSGSCLASSSSTLRIKTSRTSRTTCSTSTSC